MIDVRVDVAAFIADLKRIERDITAGARQALGQTAALAVEIAKSTTAFKDQTGKLRASIHRGQKSTWHHFVKASTPYAKFVEEGTRPHPIEARRKAALRFVQAGTLRFAKRVQHPGTKATHFMQKAQEAAGRELVRMLEEAIRRAVDR